MMRRKASPKARIASSPRAAPNDRHVTLGPRSDAPIAGPANVVGLLHER